MAGQFQPVLVKYVKDSCIVVEGKINTDRFFIIQAGKVRIVREVDQFMKQDNSSAAGPGDIIGAVSAMAGYSYIETAVALTDVSMLVVERKYYEDLIRSNTPVAVKIIRQFSQRLRILDEMLSRRANGKIAVSDASHLLQVADYYLNRRMFNQAFYAWQQYTVLCPGAADLAEVKQDMMKIAPKVKMLKPVYPPGTMERSYPKACIVFAEGEKGEDLFIIRKGSVKISKIVNNQEVVLAVLKKGDIFGEMALLEDKPRAATAEVLEDCTLMAVNRANFRDLINSHPELVSRLTTLMAERIWLMYKQLANSFIENPLGRIYDALLIQLEKDRVPLNTNQPHLCNFGLNELAGMAGLSPDEGSALFKKIFLSKRITVSNDKIYVGDPSEVLRQTEYYRRAMRIGNVRGDLG
ncbi:MAG: cyclic nucleotide-binding domain-containing protein [Treponema sp.]|jgi:CRP-like cAMP-binding protein|nr:cyclic nucleotide-binding domain-containing protein [Treponema sp.]